MCISGARGGRSHLFFMLLFGTINICTITHWFPKSTDVAFSLSSFQAPGISDARILLLLTFPPQRSVLHLTPCCSLGTLWGGVKLDYDAIAGWWAITLFQCLWASISRGGWLCLGEKNAKVTRHLFSVIVMLAYNFSYQSNIIWFYTHIQIRAAENW